MREDALALLRQALGNESAEFREGQWEAIEAAVQRRARILVVQRTGWGKSIVYFLATRLLRDQGAGCTLLISPLLSLMRNQIAAAARIGITARTINSTNKDDWNVIERELLANRVDILLISPERLANDDFVQRCLLSIASRLGLFVVDEAHCISDWGHDFRPDYRRIVRIVRSLPRGVPVIATTATANDRVVADIAGQLGPNLEVQRGPLIRKSLSLQNLYLGSQAERMAWLADILPELPGSGIVYTLTIRDAERVARWLRSRGIDAEHYHGARENAQRVDLEERLLHNDLKALVATVALGMGFDKPDLGFVIHFQRPGSVVHYYQQVGRAGRALDDAYGVLLNGDEDDDIADFFIRTAFPSPAHVKAVLMAMRAAQGAQTAPSLEHSVNLSHGKLQTILKFLSLESPSPIQKTSEGYVLNPVAWEMPTDRIERITQLRRDEQQQMGRYMECGGCLMSFLSEALNDPNAEPCGRCANCVGGVLPTTYSEDTIEAASAFLGKLENPIPPRKRWPSGDSIPGMHGSIPSEERAQEGRSLCHWGDPGFGAAVRSGKQREGRFNDRLLDASVSLIRDRWAPSPFPEWVTCVPSRRHQELVPDFARRLAARLGLPFMEVIAKTRETEPQKTRANSYQQAANVSGAFEVDETATLPGPALLVDDLVDSKWTFTVVAALLQRAGSGPVFPFALAYSSSEDGN